MANVADQNAPTSGSSHTESLSSIVVPESTMIGHPSLFSNIWQPSPERIIVEEECLQAQQVTVEIKSGITGTLLDHRSEGKKARLFLALEQLRDGPVLKMGEQLVYDARFAFNDNVAHLIGHHVANLAFAKHHLGIEPGSCLVVLGRNTSQMAHRLFELLGYETCETNRAVGADQLTVSVNNLESYLLLPYVHELEPPGIPAGGVEKLFISRKSSRRIANEEEIWPIVSERGYQRVFFEDIPLAQQWGLVRDATSIISIHGAALGYLSTKTRIPQVQSYKMLEIFSPGLVADIFRKTSAAIGGSWMCCRGRISSEFVAGVEESNDVKSMDARDFELHPDTLIRALDLGGF